MDSTQETTPTAPVESSAQATVDTTPSPTAPDTQSQATVEASQPQAPAYTPNFKFKAYDKEYEVPELFRAVVKDPETEKQVREVFEKSYALDNFKTIHTGLKEKFNNYQAQTAPILKLAQELDYYQKKGDLGSYFKTLGFNDQQIMEYALQKAQQMELSPDQKRVYDEREAANRERFMLETQFRQQQEQLMEIKVQQREFELQNVLAKPDVQSFVQAFDSRNGQGAFFQECKQRGQSHFALTGEDLTPEQVVQSIVNRFAPMVQAQTQMAQNQGQPKAPAEVPVIPNTGSGSSSPAQKSFKSLDELRKYRAENFG